MSPDPAQKTRRIVLIEDNADAAASLKLLLEMNGHEVAVASDGVSGLEKVRSMRPDVVLCDIRLPGGMDGYEVARAIRQEPSCASTRLVAVTGLVQDKDASRAREAGFDVRVLKPIGLEAIEGILERLDADASGDPEADD